MTLLDFYDNLLVITAFGKKIDRFIEKKKKTY